MDRKKEAKKRRTDSEKKKKKHMCKKKKTKEQKYKTGMDTTRWTENQREKNRTCALCSDP